MNISYQSGTPITIAENSSGQDKPNPKHPEDFWRRLIEIEKECAFEGITAEDLLISKFMTTITDTKLWDKLMKEKKLELKKTIEMIKQNTYERKNRKNTIPEGLILHREKEIKKNRYKEWKDPTQDRRTNLQMRNHANFATRRTGTLLTNARHWENFVTTAKEGTLRTGMQTKRQLQTESTQCDRRLVRNNWRRIRRIRNKHTQN